MYKAAIDIGSNSVQFIMIEEKSNKVLIRKSIVTGLGKGLKKNKIFSPESMKSTEEGLQEVLAIIDDYNIDRKSVLAVSTEASRVAQNSSDFWSLIESKTSLKVYTINPEAETLLTQMAILQSSQLPKDFVLIDIGGASTEFSLFKNQKSIRSISIPIGSVLVTDILNDYGEDEAVLKINSYLNRLDWCKRTNIGVCVAGTMTSIGNMYLGNVTFEEDEVDSLEINVEKLQKNLTEWMNLDRDLLLGQFPFLGKRISAIRGGMELSKQICTSLEFKTLYASTKSLVNALVLKSQIDPSWISPN
jgi:exopolyphosphatase/guanosine-5'-triphosphate,3'-diphosphate pyrophosphatase